MNELPDLDRARRVAGALGVPEPSPPADPAPEPAPAPGARGVAKRVLKRALGPVLDRTLPRLGKAMAPHIPLASPVAELHEQVARLETRLESVRHALDVPPPVTLAERLNTNQELLKAELQSLRRALEDFGLAIAPAAGLDGAPARLGELRARVDLVDKRLRAMLDRSAPAPDEEPVLPATFDYVGFEYRFRGDAELVLRRSQERYFDRLEGASPVLDVGCGRGELLAALAARGVEGVGVDLDAAMVAEAKAAGVDARHGDAIQFLADAAPASFGAVVAIQVAEHLELDALLALIELSYARLRPGGTLILETPNPASLIVLGNSYLLDPTHVRPLHPSLLTFLVERAGFADVRLELYDPATGYHLELLDEAEVPEPWVPTVNAAFRRLNDVLFGPQDYAVIATR